MSDDRSPDLIVEEWLRHAADDEQHIRVNLNHRDGSAAAVCLIAHQMGEKLLKALLVDRTGTYDRVHNLRTLLDQIEATGVSVRDDLREAAVRLNPYYVGARYPADVPIESYTWSEADEACAAALAIKVFVLEQLGRSTEEDKDNAA